MALLNKTLTNLAKYHVIKIEDKNYIKKLNLIMSLLCCMGSEWLAPSPSGSESSSGPDLGMPSNPVDRIQLAEVQKLDMNFLNINHPLVSMSAEIIESIGPFLAGKLTSREYAAQVQNGYVIQNGEKVQIGSNAILNIWDKNKDGQETILKLVCGEVPYIVYEQATWRASPDWPECDSASKSLTLNNESKLVEYTGPVLSKNYYNLNGESLPETTPPALLLILSYLPYNLDAIEVNTYRDGGSTDCQINLKQIYALNEIIGTTHPDRVGSLILISEVSWNNRSPPKEIFFYLDEDKYEFHVNHTESAEFANRHVRALIETIESLLPDEW